MKEVTKKDIEDAIKNCYWLSENRMGNLFPGICSGECLPCSVVIDNGRCDTLKELFKGIEQLNMN